MPCGAQNEERKSGQSAGIQLDKLLPGGRATSISALCPSTLIREHESTRGNNREPERTTEILKPVNDLVLARLGAPLGGVSSIPQALNSKDNAIDDAICHSDVGSRYSAICYTKR